jgi:hypothetical protein
VVGKESCGCPDEVAMHGRLEIPSLVIFCSSECPLTSEYGIELTKVGGERSQFSALEVGIWINSEMSNAGLLVGSCSSPAR